MKNVTKSAEPPTIKRTQGPALTISVQRAMRAQDAPTRVAILRFVRAAIAMDAEITIRIVNEIEACRLNRDFRNKDYATNVLSFAYQTSPCIMGDLVLCAPVITREALAQGKTNLAHYAHLIVHGLLHLQGYDHENEAEALIMETQEIKIVTGLGFANPYLETEPQNHGRFV